MKKHKSKSSVNLNKLTSDELLECRISDLPLNLKNTWLAECIVELYKELDDKGIVFKPQCYLADEWLTPDKEPVIGIPFYLADPVLIKLEKKMMYEVEGGTKQWCMKLLRHEAGHAFNYAYRLYKRKKWNKIFGSFNEEYLDTYRFRPYSKKYVRHLENHYAQCHPDEDFAETFAVVITPGLDWHETYKGWKALKKLEYVDQLLKGIGGKPPLVLKGKKYWSLSQLRITLKNYYKKKQHIRAEEFPVFHDIFLEKLFIGKEKPDKNDVPAYKFLQKIQGTILNCVSYSTGERKFIIKNLIKTIIKRCRECRLYLKDDPTIVISQLTSYVTTLVMNYVHTGSLKG